MNQYYVSWYTWHMGQVTTPWDFWFLSKGSRYKPVKPGIPAWNPQQAQQAFDQGDVKQLHELELNYVRDVKLMAFVEAQDVSQAQDQILQVFPDAEFDRVAPVDDATRQQILVLIGQTLANHMTK